ncbi:hypothetical protein CC86DRAFT_303754, partial [Ophiobolus disseminans]
NQLLLYKNKGLRESLSTKKKRKNYSRKLNLQKEGEYYRGVEWWSPRSFKRASERQAQKEQDELEENLQKAERKQIKASNALLKKRLQEEKRVKRERLKEEREKEKERKA